MLEIEAESPEDFFHIRSEERPFRSGIFARMDFGAILQRERGKLSREELAAKTKEVDPEGKGVSDRSIYNWETNKRSPTLLDVELIAKALKKPLSNFIMAELPPAEYESPTKSLYLSTNRPVTREEVELVRLRMDLLDEETRGNRPEVIATIRQKLSELEKTIRSERDGNRGTGS